jgi:serine/threonine-protein kinase RsbW
MDARDDALGRMPRREPVAGSQLGDDSPWVDEDVVTVRSSLTIEEAATAYNIAAMRRTFSEWLALDLAASDLLDDVVLAVYEALANVADHAYVDSPDGPGPARLTAHRAHGSLRIAISDDGHWRTITDGHFRNHGLPLIRLLITDVYIETTALGTTVHLRADLPAPDPTC